MWPSGLGEDHIGGLLGSVRTIVAGLSWSGMDGAAPIATSRETPVHGQRQRDRPGGPYPFHPQLAQRGQVGVAAQIDGRAEHLLGEGFEVAAC